MKATRTAVFVFAARNGHLDILKWIKRHAPYSFKHVVKWRGWEAFRQAYYREHLDICNWLLEYPSCFAYVEERDPAFGLVLHPFIEKKLNDLRQKAMTHTGNSPFDIHSRTQAKLYFYIASNLIRRNDRSLDDSLHFLLNIPHVKDLADQEVTPNESNELLRLALKVGNREAAAMLLNIENVRVLAADNNFYEEELLGSISLRQLVRDRESSMTALTSGEKKRLETAIAKYQPMLETTSVPLLMDALRQQLMERYEAHPACIIINEVATILPAQWNSFKDLNLQGDDYKKALIAYYQNKNHTAWRYLSKPNPWMHAEAEYVCVNEDKTKRWADFEEYQSLIAMHWLAVNDESTEPSHGHTMEGRLNHFVDELALLGRSHNWDKTRMGFSGKEEEFDDLEADRPSCYSGVKRRVFQSVIGHPLFQILTKEILNLEIKDFALTYFKSKITHRNKQRLLSAFKNYCNQLTEESAAPLECLNIPQEAQVGFEDYLKQRYADQYTDDADLMAHVRQSITLNLQSPNVSDHLHALKLDGITQISCYLQKLNHVRSSEVGLFSASTPERRVTPERAVKKRRVEHGI